MRGGIGLFGCVLLAVGCSGQAGTRAAGASLVADRSSVDFSLVALHASKTVKLGLRNVGEVPLPLPNGSIDGRSGTFSAAPAQGETAVLAPGARTLMTLRFSPAKAGQAKGSLVIDSGDGTSVLRLPLAGIGVDTAAVFDTKALDFGKVELRSSERLGLSLRNPSALATTVSVRTVGTNAADFSSAGVVLPPHASAELSVVFQPSALGVRKAQLEVTPCAGCQSRAVTLTGEGIASALVADPPQLDFGRVPVDRAPTLDLGIRNISVLPVTVLGGQLAQATDESFQATFPPFPVVIGPGQLWRMPVRYSPGHMGPATGGVDFSVQSAENPRLSVPLKGIGGAAELCVTPTFHDFGTVPVGSKTELKIHVVNCGASDGPPLTIHDLTFTEGGGGPFVIQNPPLPATLAAGEALDLPVFYVPTEAGGAKAELLLDTDGFEGKVNIGLQGTAKVYPPCQLKIAPGAVSFGTVDPGRGAVLGVSLRNVGNDLCAVKNVHISDDGGGVFGMPGGAIPGWILYPGSWFTFEVSFIASKGAGVFVGTLSLEQADPANPLVEIPLTATAAQACLVATPWYVDFGTSRPDCPRKTRQVALLDACAEPVTIGDFQIGPGSADGEFSLDDTPAVPLTLQPGEATHVSVGYLAQVFGLNLSPLFIYEDDVEDPLLVPLVGDSSAHPRRTDTFVQQDGRKMDVLFVVDDTASMIEEQPRLVAAIPAFVQAALARDVDLHVAVTTTGIDPSNSCTEPAQGGDAGRLVPLDGSAPRMLTQNTPNLSDVLSKNVQVGTCTGLEEQGLEAMRRALSSPLVDHADDPATALPDDGNLGFLRPAAGLSVVFVSDEDDHSPDDVKTYVRFLRSVKGANQPQRATIFGITPNGTPCATEGGDGTRYAEAAQLTGGQVLSVCSDDFAPLLEEVASEVFSAQTAFVLGGTPAAADEVEVTVDGARVTTGWHYDAAQNAVVFDTPPAPGAKITVDYLEACGD